MKKSLVAAVLALVMATVAAGQAPTPPKKEIKDSAEYNAYTSALNAPDAQAKIQGFENFVHQFPNSAFKEDALEFLMNAYQQTNNTQKTVETGKAILAVNPNNVRALALLSYFARALAEAGQNPQQNIADARTYGTQGLKAVETMTKPEGVPDDDFKKLKTQTTIIFDGAVGFAALQSKEYASAAKSLQAAIDLEPPTAESLHNLYPLAVANLEQSPMNPVGLWYVARAAAFSKANAAGYAAITKYGRARYIKYHGGDDGWDQLLAQAAAATSNALPQGFAIAPAPSLAEQAATLAASKSVDKMSFDELQLILTSGNQPVADKAWGQLKGVPQRFAARLVEASKTKLMLAATYDNVQANKADIELTMTAPILTKDMPKVGTEIKVEGTPDTLDISPFMIHMTKGSLLQVKPAAKPAPRKGTTHRKTTN